MNENPNEILKRAGAESESNVESDVEQAPVLEAGLGLQEASSTVASTISKTKESAVRSGPLSPEQVLEQGDPTSIVEPQSLDPEAQISTLNGLFDQGGNPPKEKNLGDLGSELTEQLSDITAKS